MSRMLQADAKRLSGRAVAVSLLLLAVGGAITTARADQPVAVGDAADRALPYQPSAANLAAREWFQDARFGVMICWGLYSVTGIAGPSGFSEFLIEDNKIPNARYEQIARWFNPTRFDADAWASVLQRAGVRYVVFTAKHMDGFAMFKTALSDFNVVDRTPFGRDPVRELAAALSRHGIKLFFYYCKLDYRHPDYYPRGGMGHYTGRPEHGDWERYLDFQDGQVRELLTQYGPVGGIWFDGWWDQADGPMRDRWRLRRTYDMIHSLQPAALIVNNSHVAPFPGEDYQTFERDLPGENLSGLSPNQQVSGLPLETADMINNSWGFNLGDDGNKSVETLLRRLVGAAGRGANLLLATGALPTGELPEAQASAMLGMGEWLSRYGESIYGTRAGPISPRPWGVTTSRGSQVYVHILDWTDEWLFLPLVGHAERATLLRSGQAVSLRQLPGGVEIRLPPRLKGEWDQVVAITTGGRTATRR